MNRLKQEANHQLLKCLIKKFIAKNLENAEIFMNQTFIISITLLLENIQSLKTKELILNIILYINIYLPLSSSAYQTNEMNVAEASQIQRKTCDTNIHNQKQKIIKW